MRAAGPIALVLAVALTLAAITRPEPRACTQRMPCTKLAHVPDPAYVQSAGRVLYCQRSTRRYDAWADCMGITDVHSTDYRYGPAYDSGMTPRMEREGK